MNESKLHEVGTRADGQRIFLFYCPGCKAPHPYEVPRWTWNGSLDKPTFTPSLLCNQHDPAIRCHLFVTDGRIQFCGDCWHPLSGSTVDMIDWDVWSAEDEAKERGWPAAQGPEEGKATT